MNLIDAFFEKAINNSVLVECLKKLKKDIWGNLSFKEKMDLFHVIMGEFFTFYPELGAPRFDFVVLDDGIGGEETDDATLINVKSLEDESCYEVLITCIHELRHFYQKAAIELYETEGILHELFSEEEIVKFSENFKYSIFGMASNYVWLDDSTIYEYKLQPIEYDAENFACEFMKRFSDYFLDDREDIDNCRVAYSEFDVTKKMHEGNKHDIIEFGKIYSLNYEDKIKENRVVFEKEEILYGEYLELIKKLDNLDDVDILKLMNPGVMSTFDSATKVSVFNAYLAYMGSPERIVFDCDDYYFNNSIFDVTERNSYKLIEPLFLQLANEKIEEILKKSFNELSEEEKKVKLNLTKNSNIIKQEDNPLLYRLQPYVLYISDFVKNEYLKLIRSVDEPYDSYNVFFEYFSKYIKKYDNEPIKKKAEVLFGESFEKIYKRMTNKMMLNILAKGKVKTNKTSN